MASPYSIEAREIGMISLPWDEPAFLARFVEAVDHLVHDGRRTAVVKAIPVVVARQGLAKAKKTLKAKDAIAKCLFDRNAYQIYRRMDGRDLELLLIGNDDERLLDALYRSIGAPQNDSQRTFCRVWEASELLASDGFESLFEQSIPLSEYAASFVKMGMSEVNGVFDRVLALIPPKLLLPESEDILFEHLRSLFEDLKALLYEYYDKSRDLTNTIARYVREHQSDFLNTT
jgi:hypothetical protein